MTDDSILKPLDITEPTESTDSTESTEPTAETAPTDSNRNNSALETYDSPYGRIAPVTITSEMKRSYLDYAMSVIVSRALPDVRDGLKPVHRRILFAMKELGITHKGKHKKSARIVGEVLGKYHPHGDTAVYDAMVRLAQEFSMRYPLVDGQGNFGSVDGDSPAAMRYTEARLDKITQELLVDLDRDTVDWVDNFDGSYKEPTVLPAALPNLLLMGSDGIAVGMATKIPPHHLTEVVDAIHALAKKSTSKRTKTEFDENTLENENPSDLTGDLESSATIDDLLEHIQGPDFPTGGTIYDQEAVQEVYRTGKGRVVTRAEAVIEETKSGKFQIIVTELPYQVNKANLVAKIANLVRDKKLTGISDLRDESDREGMRIVIVMKKSARPKSVLNNLFKQTALQSTFSANVVALDDQGRPHLMNLKTILMHYLKHRQIVVVRRSQHDLKSARARIHILEGYLKALDHLDEVIETIKKSKNSDEAKTNLIKKFEFSEIQAVAILDMQLRKLSALERQKIQDEYDALMSKIKGLTGLLLDPQAIIALILKELKEIEKLYHDERRTRVVKGKLGQFSEEDLIAKVDNLVTITKGGYIKRMPLGTYRSQRRGGKGVVGMTTKEEDEILKMAVANTHDYALFFTDTGKVFMNRVFELPEGSRTAKGQAIINHLGISQDEKIEALLTVSKEVLESKDFFITMATRKGQVKKTSIKEYANIRVSGKIGISLRDGDTLVKAQVTDGKNYLLLVTHSGKSIKFKESDVKPTGRDTMGVKGINLKGEDFVIAAETFEITPDKPDDKRRKFFREILVVTENGIGKRTAVSEYPSQNRGGQGVKVAELSKKTGLIAAARMVTELDREVVITTRGAQVIKLPLKNIKVLSRSTQGVILMRPAKGDLITSVTTLQDNSGEEE